MCFGIIFRINSFEDNYIYILKKKILLRYDTARLYNENDRATG